MSRNDDLLESFTYYCADHPEQRFWQALRNWSGHNFILVSQLNDGKDQRDTFYWNTKEGR